MLPNEIIPFSNAMYEKEMETVKHIKTFLIL